MRLTFDIGVRTYGRIPVNAARELDMEMGFAIARSTSIMQNLAIGYINRDTGRTAQTIEQLVIGNGTSHVTGYVGSDDQIAIILEFGSRAHVITPTVKQALWWEGLPHPVASVQHPGTMPYLWLTRSGERAGDIAKAELALAFARVFG